MVENRESELFYMTTFYGRYRFEVYPSIDYYLKNRISIEHLVENLIALRWIVRYKVDSYIESDPIKAKKFLSHYEDWDKDRDYPRVCEAFCNVLVNETIDISEDIIEYPEKTKIEDFKIQLSKIFDFFNKGVSEDLHSEIDQEILIPEIDEVDREFFKKFMKKLEDQSEEHNNK